jgi:hypothetical protein
LKGKEVSVPARGKIFAPVWRFHPARIAFESRSSFLAEQIGLQGIRPKSSGLLS